MQETKTGSAKVWKLKASMTFTRPRYWDIHLRYAVLLGGEEISLNPDTWLLELGPNQESVVTPGQEPGVEYLYRLASGETVALDRALTLDEAWPEDHLQVIAALTAFRTLDQAILEDWGVQIEHIDHLPPFGLIKCPLCGGTEFVSVDFAAVYCSSCNTSFSVRHTAGDPGFVVDGSPRHTWLGATRYLIPRSGNLLLYMVYKNGSDPRQKPAGKNLSSEHLAQTDPTHTSLRPGLYTYHIGDLYEWKLSGLVPTLQELDQDSTSGYTWKIEGEWWPLSAYVRVSGLTDHQKAVLEGHLRHLLSQEAKDETLTEVITELVHQRASRRIGVHFNSEGLPPLKDLTENQRYLLHHWLVCTTGNSPYTLTAAYPVWYMVEPILSEEADPVGHYRIEGWEVIGRDLCPVCHRPVVAQEMTFHAEAARQRIPLDEDRDWYLPHGRCREVWEKGKWSLYQSAGNAIRELPEKLTELSERYWLVMQTDFREGPPDEGHRLLFAVIRLEPEVVSRLFWWSQVAQGNQRDINCMGTTHVIRLPSYFTVSADPAWKDCFTRLSLVEQNGYVILNRDPWVTSEDEEPIIERVGTQHPWINCDRTGEIGWSAHLPAVSTRHSPRAIETAKFGFEGLKWMAELMGIAQSWEEKHRLIVETMTGKASPGQNKESR
ncbi:MAG: hypothetical protein KJ077_00735 [Anaerolineae bacterium]|nr:hypothetical protein [Anaerolineae bacterium]